MKKEVLVVKRNFEAQEEMRIEERVKANGVIEELRVRFYPGVERELQVQVYVNHKVRAREDLITYHELTEQFISGDDDYLIFPVSVPVEYDDDIVIFAKNVSQNYRYTLAVDVIISYDGEGY